MRYYPALDRGGRLTPPPPSRIFAIAQKRTALSTSNLADLLIPQFDIVCEFFFKSVEKIWDMVDVVTSLHATFGRKLAKLRGSVENVVFNENANKKTQKRRKTRSSTRWLSRFFKILGFWPLKFQKIDFFGKWTLKSTVFKIFKKP